MGLFDVLGAWYLIDKSMDTFGIIPTLLGMKMLGDGAEALRQEAAASRSRTEKLGDDFLYHNVDVFRRSVENCDVISDEDKDRISAYCGDLLDTSDPKKKQKAYEKIEQIVRQYNARAELSRAEQIEQARRIVEAAEEISDEDKQRIYHACRDLLNTADERMEEKILARLNRIMDKYR